MLYVAMTDKFMSGWGHSREKLNKLVFECETEKEARIVFDNANNRTDQKYINICYTKPYYNKDKYYTQIKNKEIYPCWYKENYFKKEFIKC